MQQGDVLMNYLRPKAKSASMSTFSKEAVGLFAINSVFMSLLLEHIQLIAFMVVLKEGETDVLAVWLNVISLQALTGKINSFPSTVPES